MKLKLVEGVEEKEVVPAIKDMWRFKGYTSVHMRVEHHHGEGNRPLISSFWSVCLADGYMFWTAKDSANRDGMHQEIELLKWLGWDQAERCPTVCRKVGTNE